MRLTTITNPPTIRPRRRQPLRSARLGSPFDFHPVQRPTTPSTATSLTSLTTDHRPGRPVPADCPSNAQYWLRSSSESELEHLINTLRTPHDLKILIDYGRRSADHILLSRCHAILGQSLITFLAIGKVEEADALRGMELNVLCAQADAFGFWSVSSLPVVQEAEGMDVDMAEGGYATPPHQISWRQY